MVYPKDQTASKQSSSSHCNTAGPQFLAPSTLTGPQFSMGARREAGLAVAAIQEANHKSIRSTQIHPIHTGTRLHGKEVAGSQDAVRSPGEDDGTTWTSCCKLDDPGVLQMPHHEVWILRLATVALGDKPWWRSSKCRSRQ